MTFNLRKNNVFKMSVENLILRKFEFTKDISERALIFLEEIAIF